MITATDSWYESVIGRLPKRDFIGIVDVSLAFGVSATTVMEWINERRLEAVNLNAGTAKRAFWSIPRSSAVALARYLAER